jgi:hypothetical protein
MNNRTFVLKIIAATFLLSMVFISASSSISLEQQPSSTFIANQHLMKGTAGMSAEEIVGISAAVAAAGAVFPANSQ